MTITITWGIGAFASLTSETALPSDFTVRRDDGRTPYVEIDVVVRDGHTICEAIRVHRREDGASLSGEALKSIRVADLIEFASREAAMRRAGDGSDGSVFWEPANPDDRRVRRDVNQAQTRGPYKLTQDHLAEVARVYREALAKPTQAVARAFDVKVRTATNWVAAARQRGFIEPYERSGVRP